MQARVEGDLVRLEAPARERFYDSRGYGRPRGDGLDVSRVEAAHLLYRGDLESVDGRGFRSFLAAEPGLAARFLVYADLRDRGFYLSPAREGWVDDPAGVDLVVYPRGKGPWDEAVEHRVRVVAEHDPVPAADLGDLVLAVVDEESELTYLETDRPTLEGTSGTAPESEVDAVLLDDRVLAWDPPTELYERGFYGQPLDDEGTALQLSLVEAADLADRDILSVPGGREAVLECGRAVEGERFDRRLRAYRTLRERGVVPKTGFKFGADFRTYADVSTVSELGHSEHLVRVVGADHVFSPRDLSLDVRLAHGVRKRMVFALVGDDVGSVNAGAGGREDDGGGGERAAGTEGSGDADDQRDAGPAVAWLSVGRLTP